MPYYEHKLTNHYQGWIFGGSLLESLLAVDIANDAVVSFFGPDLRPKLFLTTANCF